jgi:hypothetical protein
MSGPSSSYDGARVGAVCGVGRRSGGCSGVEPWKETRRASVLVADDAVIERAGDADAGRAEDLVRRSCAGLLALPPLPPLPPPPPPSRGIEWCRRSFGGSVRQPPGVSSARAAGRRFCRIGLGFAVESIVADGGRAHGYL